MLGRPLALTLGLSLLATPPSAGQCSGPNTDSILTNRSDTIILRVEAWRDFRPIKQTADGGSDLMISVSFESPARRPVRLAARVQNVSVRSGGAWFDLSVDSMRMSSDSSRLDTVGRNGPSWQPGTPIDVTVGWSDPSGKTHCTGVRRLIGRTQ
jgi:hypothetical protein